MLDPPLIAPSPCNNQLLLGVTTDLLLHHHCAIDTHISIIHHSYFIKKARSCSWNFCGNCPLTVTPPPPRSIPNRSLIIHYDNHNHRLQRLYPTLQKCCVHSDVHSRFLISCRRRYTSPRPPQFFVNFSDVFFGCF